MEMEIKPKEEGNCNRGLFPRNFAPSLSILSNKQTNKQTNSETMTIISTFPPQLQLPGSQRNSPSKHSLLLTRKP